MKVKEVEAEVKKVESGVVNVESLEYQGFKAGLDRLRKVLSNGIEYWLGRELQGMLGYDTWERFQDAIERATQAAESVGVPVSNHFLGTAKEVSLGSGARRAVKDVFLSRFACYLVAMNGDPKKPEIAFAQAYFATKTREQELLEEDDKRIEARSRVRDANRDLNRAAAAAGVVRFGIFYDEGYKTLYGGLGLVAIKKKKGIPTKHDLLDRAGRAELAANEFRITQTEEALEGVAGEGAAFKTHARVGREVRQAIRNIGGRMPEDLAPELPIRLIESARRKAKKITGN